MANAFTLLEVILGVAILALTVLSIYRFLQVQLEAVNISTQTAAANRRIEALASVVQAQLEQLPRFEEAPLLGEAHIFNDLPADEVTWLCPAGNGLFTRHATGLFSVRLVMRPATDGSTRYDLGIERLPWDRTQVDAGTPKIGQKPSWVPLIRNVKAMEIRYFDPRLNAWVEKWTDRAALPALLRLRLWRAQDTEAYETILRLPPGQGRVRPPEERREPGPMPPLPRGDRGQPPIPRIRIER